MENISMELLDPTMEEVDKDLKGPSKGILKALGVLLVRVGMNGNTNLQKKNMVHLRDSFTILIILLV